jgi:hypothetical protein
VKDGFRETIGSTNGSSSVKLPNGKGRLFVQTLLPRQVELRLRSGEELYRYDGQDFPRQRDTGPAPECRIEISPVEPRQVDFFLQVLTAAQSRVESVPAAKVEEDDQSVRLQTDGAIISLVKNGWGA